MKRFAFTIILNGLHHLKHNDYYKFMLDNFDYWVVAEGASNSLGSTSWCKRMPDNYHDNGHSVDETVEFLQKLSNNHNNFKYVSKNGFWNSKDEQVNGCISVLKNYENSGFLWQVDCDEQWSLENIKKAEDQLIQFNLETAAFPARSWVGKDMLAVGEWGECITGGYTRLWNWKGQYFKTHEPPELEGGNGNKQMLPIYFDHYNYYFEQDVEFKDSWYRNHEGIYNNWKKLQTMEKNNFPIGIEYLFNDGWVKNTKTQIIYKK